MAHRAIITMPPAEVGWDREEEDSAIVSPPPPVSLRLTIDEAALVSNWRALHRLSSGFAGGSAGAVVKANAYGLGARRVVPLLRGTGCRHFFVAHWQEAAALLGLAPPEEIAVLSGPATLTEAAYARATGLTPVINSVHQARIWRATGGGRCHAMIDTGINRLGLSLDTLGDEAVMRLDIDLLMSHYASADEDVAQNADQRERFAAARAHLPHRRTSLANSAAIALGPAYHGDVTRPGLALYGGVPRPKLAAHVAQVARPEATLIQVRTLNAGDSVGYNATFTAPTNMRVGVVALGYADGYLRCWSGRGMMRWGDKRLPVLGRVSMDLTVIDLAEAPALAEGDWVSVDYHLPTAALTSGLSQYELLTLLGRRFAR